MRERPILFSGPMVRAILEGRKTQTRRVVTVRGEQPPPWATFAAEGHSPTYTSWSKPTGLFYWSESDEAPSKELRRWPILPPSHAMAGDHYWTPCPYGKPGDHLWVRETWAQPAALDPGPTVYRADYPACVPKEFENVPDAAAITWKPSIHMPRAMSRITLEITGVRVERLQAITNDDAYAEGSSEWAAENAARLLGAGNKWRNIIEAWKALWDGINASRGHGWDANPWVWAVEFRRIEQ